MSRIIAVINGKGGVGKTSITANTAGLLAAAGYRILVVDLDPQGNLGVDLGYIGAGLSDDGASLMTGCVAGQAPTPITGVRPNLDVVPGGAELHDLAAYMQTRKSSGRGGVEQMAASIKAVARGYDLALLDCPPGNAILQEGALAAAMLAMIPTKTDDASRAGLREVARRFQTARTVNPGLELLGVVIFGVKPGASRLLRLARSRLAVDLGGEDSPNYEPIFETTIRHVEGAAVDGRRRGQLAHELEQDLAAALPWYEVLRNRQKRLTQDDHVAGDTPKEDTPTQEDAPLAASAVSLAGDYAKLADEMLTRLEDAEARVPA